MVKGVKSAYFQEKEKNGISHELSKKQADMLC